MVLHPFQNIAHLLGPETQFGEFSGGGFHVKTRNNPLHIEYFLENYIQSPQLLPKIAELGFWSQDMRNVLKRIKKQFSIYFTFYRLAKLNSKFLGL